ncbi:unnamed protein product, partial [Phaeothamnion confervicola]
PGPQVLLQNGVVFPFKLPGVRLGVVRFVVGLVLRNENEPPMLWVTKFLPLVRNARLQPSRLLRDGPFERKNRKVHLVLRDFNAFLLICGDQLGNLQRRQPEADSSGD